MDWSDIPFILAVCEAGSLSGAARTLGVNHSTVFRRVEGVESRLGVRLFDRLSHGYIMTVAGEHFYREARLLRDGMHGILRELNGRDLRLQGPLAVTTTDSLLHFLAPVFCEFQNAYPEIELTLVSDARSYDLLQRDADVAIRPTDRPPDHLSGRLLGPIVCASYSHRDYWRTVKNNAPSTHRWITVGRNLSQSPMSKLAKQRMPPDATRTIANTVMGAFELVRSGLGCAVLPCYLGEKTPELTRVDEADDQLKWNVWALSPPELRQGARVEAFFEFASTRIASAFTNLM
ncbi:MAG: LysR family transcriptional regulator [Myxococcota bacterium]